MPEGNVETIALAREQLMFDFDLPESRHDLSVSGAHAYSHCLVANVSYQCLFKEKKIRPKHANYEMTDEFPSL